MTSMFVFRLYEIEHVVLLSCRRADATFALTFRVTLVSSNTASRALMFGFDSIQQVAREAANVASSLFLTTC